MSIEIIQKTDYSTNLTLILEQFKNSTRLKGVIDSMNDQADDLEKAIFEIRDFFYVDTAIGVQLDVIGSIFSEDRLGRDDTDYRAAIKTKGSTITSGEPESIIAILRELFGGTFVTFFQAILTPAAYYVQTDAVITTAEMKIFSAAGVQPNLLFPLEFEDSTIIEFEDGNTMFAVE